MAPAPGSKEWLDGFIKSLQQSNSARANSVTPKVTLPTMTADAFRNIAKPQDFSPTEGVVSRAFDILLRPLMATAQTTGSIAAGLTGGKEGIESNPLKAAWQGASGQNKDIFSDILPKLGLDGVPGAVVGTAADLVFDPANLIFGSAGAKAFKAAKGATKAGKAARRLELSDKNIRLANEASGVEGVVIREEADKLADNMWTQQQTGMRADTAPLNDAMATLQAESAIYQESIRDTLNKFTSHQGAAERRATLNDLRGKISDQDYEFLKSVIDQPYTRRVKAREMMLTREPGVRTFADDAAEATTFQARHAQAVAKAEELARIGDEIVDTARTAGYKPSDMTKVASLATTKASVITQKEASENMFKHIGQAKTASLERSGKDILKDMDADATASIAKEQAELLAKNPSISYEISSGLPGGAVHNLSPTDVWNAIPEAVRHTGVIKYTTSYPTEGILGMAARAADFAGVTTLKALGKVDKDVAAKARGYMVKMTEKQSIETAMKESIEAAGKHNLGPKGLRLNAERWRTEKSVSSSIPKLSNALFAARQTLADAATSQAIVREARDALSAKVIAAKAAEQFDRAMTKPDVKDAVKNSANPDRLVTELPKGSDAEFMAKETLAEHIANATNQFDTATAKTVEANIRDYAQSRINTAARKIRDRGYKTYSEIRKEAEEIIKTKLGVNAEDFPYLDNAIVQMSVIRKRNILLGLVKSFGSDSGDFAKRFAGNYTYNNEITKMFEGNLHKIFQEVPESDIAKVVNAFQRSDGIEGLNPALREVAETMREDMDMLFGIKDGMYGMLFRNGIGVDDFQKALARKGFTRDVYDLDVPAELAKNAKAANEYIANSWRHFNFEDPIKELSQIHSAMMDVASNQAIGQSMSKFGVTGNAAKALRDQDVALVKIPESIKSLTDTRFLQHVPRKNGVNQDILYPKDYVDQLINLERELNLSKNFSSDSKFGKFINNVVNPFYAAWKPLVTIARPGHNIRNAFSDAYINYMAGIKTITPYKTAFAILESTGMLPKAAEKAFGSIFGRGKRPASIKIKINGKTEDFPLSEVAEWARKDGMMPTFAAQEDIILANEGKNALERFANKIQMFGPVKFGAAWSEADTWMFRVTQYAHELGKKSYKSIDDARLFASDRARKFHPDVIGLTPEAHKYARVAMPFYSWFRQILPVVAETALTKPARLTAINKVMWGFQHGFNPEDVEGASISNPFPIARNVPTFMQDNSYMGGSFVFNLGTPTEALFDIGNNDFRRNILGMASPLAKIPIEALLGESIGTGAKIKDASEYVDQQIPGVSNLSSITGASVTGTLANWLTGESTKYKSEPTMAGRQEITSPFGIDPQRSVRMGEKQHFMNTSLLNFFTGMGVQNIDRDSLAWYASQERFNRSR